MSNDNSPNSDQIREMQLHINKLEQEKVDDKATLKKLIEMMNLHLSIQDPNVLSKLMSTNCVEEQVVMLSKELSNCKEKLNESNAHVIELLSQLKVSKQENDALKAKSIKDHTHILELKEELLKVVHGDAVLNKETIELKETLLQTQNAKKLVDYELFEAKNKIDVIAGHNAELSTQSRRIGEILNEIDPSNSKRNQLFKDLIEQGKKKFENRQYEDAIEVWLKAIDVEKSGRPTARRLGCMWSNVSAGWLELKQFDKALDSIDKAIKYAPHDPVSFYHRGLSNKNLGNKVEAAADFKKTLELDPNYMEARNELAAIKGE